jgi:CheY-like chemotaxis protein
MSQTIIIGANDPNIAYLLQRYAEESGYQSARVCQNDDLLERVRHWQPAAIILDIVQAADWTTVRRLKAEPALNHLPIIVYSCFDDPPDDWRDGVDGFWLKSILYDDFVAVIERARVKSLANDSSDADSRRN